MHESLGLAKEESSFAESFSGAIRFWEFAWSSHLVVDDANFEDGDSRDYRTPDTVNKYVQSTMVSDDAERNGRSAHAFFFQILANTAIPVISVFNSRVDDSYERSTEWASVKRISHRFCIRSLFWGGGIFFSFFLALRMRWKHTGSKTFRKRIIKKKNQWNLICKLYGESQIDEVSFPVCNIVTR